MPRKDLTLAEKISLLDLIKRQPPDTNQRRLAEMTGVPKSTIGRVMCLEGKLREEWALRGEQGKFQKRKRKGRNPIIEEALSQWYTTVTGRGERFSGPELRSKSEELARKLGFEDFKASDGWLSRWKNRNQIRFKQLSEVGSAGCDEPIDPVDSLQILSADGTTGTRNLLDRGTPDGSSSLNSEEYDEDIDVETDSLIKPKLEPIDSDPIENDSSRNHDFKPVNVESFLGKHEQFITEAHLGYESPHISGSRSIRQLQWNRDPLFELRKEKMNLEIEHIKLQNYKTKLEILKPEKELHVSRSKFTSCFPE